MSDESGYLCLVPSGCSPCGNKATRRCQCCGTHLCFRHQVAVSVGGAGMSVSRWIVCEECGARLKEQIAEDCGGAAEEGW